MVGEDHVGAELDGLVDRRSDRIDREKDAPHRGVPIAHGQADDVAVSRASDRPERLDGGDVIHGGHGTSA